MDTQFLKELIEKNARVILPEFGAFLVKDDGSGVFKAQNVTFSPFLRYNDGMVEDALATKLKIGKDQAKDQLGNFIETMKSELHSNKVFAVPGLGSLIIDNRGSIQFSTSQQSTTPPPSQPKPKVEEPKKVEEKPKASTSQEDIPQETELAKQPKKAKEEETAKAPAPTKTKVESISPVEKSVPESKEKSKGTATAKQQQSTPKTPPMSSKKQQNAKGGTGKAILFGTLIGVGVVVIAASGWYLYSKGFFSPKSKASVENVVEKPSTPIANEQTQEESKSKFEDEFEQLSAEMDVTEKDTRSEEATSKKVQKPKEKTVKEQPTPEPKVSIPSSHEGMFHIIAGSFRNADYAEKFSLDMQSAGFNSRVIVQPTGMHAVSLGSFMNRQEAVDSLNVWKLKHPNVWILNQ